MPSPSSVLSNAWLDAFPDAQERNMCVKALRSNPIALGRNIVCIIRASGLHHDKFMDIIKTGNSKNWFKGPTGDAEQVPELELLRDVKTRWDSTYAMLNRLRALHLVCNIICVGIILTSILNRKAINYFLTLPNQKELEEYVLSPQQWQVLQDFEYILQVKPMNVP